MNAICTISKVVRTTMLAVLSILSSFYPFCCWSGLKLLHKCLNKTLLFRSVYNKMGKTATVKHVQIPATVHFCCECTHTHNMLIMATYYRFDILLAINSQLIDIKCRHAQHIRMFIILVRPIAHVIYNENQVH